MRTAVFLGLLYVGDTINNMSNVIAESDNSVVTAMAVALFVFAIMDVMDFVKSLNG